MAVSAEALPGDSFYGVKRAAEETRILLTVSPRGRAEARLSQAETRLDAVRQLVARGVAASPQVVEALLASPYRPEAVSRDAGGAVTGPHDQGWRAPAQGRARAGARTAAGSGTPGPRRLPNLAEPKWSA